MHRSHWLFVDGSDGRIPQRHTKCKPNVLYFCQRKNIFNISKSLLSLQFAKQSFTQQYLCQYLCSGQVKFEQQFPFFYLQKSRI